MQNYFKRKLCIFIFTFILCFFIEASVFWIIFHTFYAKEFMLELAVYLMLLSPALLFKTNKYTIAYSSVFFGILIILFLLNVTLHFCSSDIFTMEYVRLVGESISVFDADFINPIAIGLAVLYIASFVFGMIGIKKLFPETEPAKGRYAPKGLLLTTICFSIGISISLGRLGAVEKKYSSSSLYQDKNGTEIIQYASTYLKKSSMKQYGILSCSLAEIGSMNQDNDVNQVLDDYFSQSKDNTPVTDEYFGIGENYNVIEIMVETGAAILVNEELTPNLYKLSNEGLNFTQTYSKNKTNQSEIIGIVGSTSSSISKTDAVIPYSAPNVLKEKGYVTTYIHDNYGSFYNRDRLIQNLGFENTYFSEDFDERFSWDDNFDGNYPLDTDFMNEIAPLLVPDTDQPFYSFWTTLSTHGPYTGEQNIAKFEILGYYDRLHAAELNGTWSNPCITEDEEVLAQYECLQCEMMCLDEAIGKLMDYLKEKGKWDNTILVVYGDHEPYYKVGIDKPLKNYIFDVTSECVPDQYNTMLFFYNEKIVKSYKEKNNISILSPAAIDVFVSPYVIVPTLLELLGVDYNPVYYVGTSYFQMETELDNIFYSHELGTLFSNQLYAIDLSGEYEYMADNVDSDYEKLFYQKSAELLEKISVFNQALSTDYFSPEKEDEIVETKVTES